MSGFYIKQVNASGSGKELSSVDFTKGLNIITGPSNTGKSFIVDVINFLFCGKKATFDELTGYTVFSMLLETDEGYSIQFTRKIDGNKVDVVSNVPNISSQSYSLSNYELSDVYLKLMGIDKPHDIISKQDKHTSRLTLRTFIHLFLIDEITAMAKTSIINHGNYSITRTLSALLFLITGEDVSNVTANESKEVKEARKKAVVGYIDQRIKNFEEKAGELNEKLISLGNVDIELETQEILEQVADTEKEIVEAAHKSKKLLKNMYQLSQQLEEAEFLRERYDALETQYLSDIKRLKFIIDGEKHSASAPIITKCPFRESDITPRSHRTYTASAETELQKVQIQISDLKKAQQEISEEIQNLKHRLSEYEFENNTIKELSERELKPRLQELKSMLEKHKNIQKVKDEIDFIKTVSAEMNADLFEKRNEDESTPIKYIPKDHFTNDMVKEFNNCLDKTLRECSYKDYLTSRIDWNIFDIVVNASKKSSEGKGYRGFLNSAFAMAIMQYLSENAAYAPGLLILDSPITNLKEADCDEGTKNSMKSAMFNCSIKYQDYGQIIVAENEIPDICYDNISITRFTKNKEIGRYGFLKNPNISKEQ